jgi:hypothetical protein
MILSKKNGNAILIFYFRTLFDIKEGESDSSNENSRVQSPVNTDRSESEGRGSRTNNKMLAPKFVKNHVVST